MTTTSLYTWLDGDLMLSKDATIPLMTAGLHYGAAVFEGMRGYATASGPALFRLRDHLERLAASADVMGLGDLPYSVDTLAAATKQLVHANQFQDCYVRPIAYLADGGWNLEIAGGRLHVGIGAWRWDAPSIDTFERGVRASVSGLTRHQGSLAATRAKIAGNYASCVMARNDSLRRGFDEAIMLDLDGNVAECAGKNLFAVTKDAIVTPPSGSIIEGMTRDTILQLARARGRTALEQRVSLELLLGADEIFSCGTLGGIVPVIEIDGRAVGSGVAGPVTREIWREFQDLVRGRHPLSSVWLEPVYRDVPEWDASGWRFDHVEAGYGHGV